MNISEAFPFGRIVIAGGSGFLGTSLAAHLAELGAEVVVLSRGNAQVHGAVRYIHWDARTLGDWQAALDGASALVNLAGRSVDCIKTPDHMDEIVRSRVEATRVLGQAVRNVAAPPPVWVQMSTAHIYGDAPELICTEDSAFGYGLAPHVGCAWEEAFRASVLPTQRGVVLRTSFVIGRNRGVGAGALDRLRTVVKLGLGGRVGSGRQGISWIHEHDLHRIVDRAVVNPEMHGAYIASSPHPVSQVEFMRALRRTMRMPVGLPATAWMVRFGAHYFLHTDPELALYGRYVIPQRLLDQGFEFRFDHLEEALGEALAIRPAGSATSPALP
ncbi:MAG: TIGR01777 family oxidoreductase [Planctomycetia bacterium]|nr:TIGR01777 family oxidoreductase [Planctomycetia bacterium]